MNKPDRFWKPVRFISKKTALQSGFVFYPVIRVFVFYEVLGFQGSLRRSLPR
jgi:hypothetical protein